MTALTVPARPTYHANTRPLPWRRVGWVIWRQHRITFAALASLLGALALYIWIAGLELHHAHVGATTCNAASPACSDLIDRFNGMNKALWRGQTLQALPALIGAFVGAPVLAREFETGTFRYAWTQGFGRWRWTLAKLVALAGVVTVAAGAISAVFSWYYQPYFATGNQTRSLTQMSPLAGAVFDLRGVVFAAWTLTAFAIGGLAGALIRRVVPAIVATLVAYAGLALVTANLLRQHYLTPLLTTKLNVPGSAWVMSQWWTKGGHFAFRGWTRAPTRIFRLCAPPPPLGARVAKPSQGSLAQCFARHGYTQLTKYQPATRFWPLQWIEGAWLLALSGLLIAATVWVVRRRVA
jgi:hypothetical protein